MTRLLAAFAAVSLLAACGDKKASPAAAPATPDGFTVDLQWLEGPFVEAYSSARLSFARPDGSLPQSVTDVAFEPMMPTHGHGTFMDDQKIAPTEGQPHVFSVTGIYFIMSGSGADNWLIDVTATVDGKRGKVQVAADVP
jgi:hypothetical protein